MQEVTEKERGKTHPPSKFFTARPNILLPPAGRLLTHVTETQP